MFSHIMIGTNDLDKAKAFYDTLLGTERVLGRLVWLIVFRTEFDAHWCGVHKSICPVKTRLAGPVIMTGCPSPDH